MAYQYINSTGTIVADTADILTEVETEYKNTFGSDLIVTADTPQGVLITTDTLARSNLENNNAALANQINPNISGGIYLDDLMALMGIQRTAATRSLVSNAALTGVAGTFIPAGTQAKTAANDLFETASDVTLAVDGTATVNFYSIEYGAIPCEVGALINVVSAVLGWETVYNAAAAVLGTDTQSDQGARAYRDNTLFFQGVSLVGAISSAVFAVSNVIDVFVQENLSWSPQTIRGIAMSPKSIYACVYGGTQADIAAALLENKSSGCAWNGSTTVTLIEPASLQAYDVSFDVAAQIGIAVRVTTTNGSAANIQQAIIDYSNGLVDGLSRWKIGSSISPFEISAAIAAVYPTYYIKKVEISLSYPIVWSTDEIVIPVDSVAYTQLSLITVVIV